MEILVEGPSRSARKHEAAGDGPGDGPSEGDVLQLVGRTTCDRIVVFDGPRRLTGQMLPVIIEKVDAFTLFGRVLGKIRTEECHDISSGCDSRKDD